MSNTIKDFFGHREIKPFVMKGLPSLTRGTNPTLLMGMELEVENCPQNDEWYADYTNKFGWTTTTDDSLRGANLRNNRVQTNGNAFEFISKVHPQSQLMYSLEEFMKVTKFNDDNYTDRTSVHVHVNCLDLTFDQISSLALLYTTVEEILFKFVGENRENNIYCIPWSGCRINHDIVDKLENEGATAVKKWAKYTALNLTPLCTQGTVEFRHMHGTADVGKLTTWLNIIGALFRYATQRSLTDVVEEIKTLNSTSEYEVFFNTVFGGTLLYSDEYREALESGVIVAKFSLINWKKSKKVKLDGSEKAAIDPNQYAIRMVYDDIERTNRFVPWPPIGTTVPITELTQAERHTLHANTGLWEAEVNLVTVTREREEVRNDAWARLQQETAAAIQRQTEATQAQRGVRFQPPPVLPLQGGTITGRQPVARPPRNIVR